ncbi:MAG: hypothetical protein K0B05_13820, partial [Bacteroidales bacterium]|nr:hypothetical protein [Bacteroidales bacterium]
MKYTLIILGCLIINTAVAQDTGTGIFNFSGDIGNPAIAGSSDYDKESQSYSIKGSGYNIWFERDEFHYQYN